MTADVQTLEQRATWLIDLWLSNDEGAYHAAVETVRNAERSDDALKELVTEAMDEIVEPLDGAMGGLTRDLVGACLAFADWKSIASGFEEVA
jgi:hypothetical protein